jgi:hypothetical protein
MGIVRSTILLPFSAPDGVLGEPHRFVAASPLRTTKVANEGGAYGPMISLLGTPRESAIILFASLQKKDGQIVAVKTTPGKDGAGTARPPQ